MKTRLFTTLRFKLALFIIVLLLVTAIIFSFLTVQTMNRHIADEVIKRVESLAKSTAAMAPYSILAGDVLGTDNIVSKVKEANGDVEYVAVTDAETAVPYRDRPPRSEMTDASSRMTSHRPYLLRALNEWIA